MTSISEKHLAEYVRQWCEQHKTNQKGLAERTGLAESTISEALTGVTKPGIKFFSRIAPVMGVTPGTLLDLYLKED